MGRQFGSKNITDIDWSKVDWSKSNPEISQELGVSCPSVSRRRPDKLRTVTKSKPKETRYSRLCHDCKTPTNDYRCPKCLSKWRKKYNVSGASFYAEPEVA